MISVEREPGDWDRMPPEHCFRCDAPTRYWYVLKDVACCPACAAEVDDAGVPTKEQWCKGAPKPDFEAI